MSNTVHLSIPGMKCGGCVNAVEEALRNQAGVTGFKVDLASKSAELEGDFDLPDVTAAISAAGFEATQVQD